VSASESLLVADGSPQKLRREVRVPIYWLVVGLAVMVVSPILSIWVSVKINQHTIAQNDAARVAQAQQFQVVYCRLLGSQVDVYSEAETDVGRAAYQTWLDEYKRSKCLPIRK
jgi:hypothetical protein